MKYIIIICMSFLGTACNHFPKDPNHTLEEARNGTLIVGYSENPPWVMKGEGAPGGMEADLVKQYAKHLNAKVEWRNDTEQSLFDMLEKNEIHLVIAGLTHETPWKKKAGITRPYLQQDKKKHVLAVPQGENALLVDLEKFLHQQHPPKQ